MSATTMPHPNELTPDHPLLAAHDEDDDPETLIGEFLPDAFDEEN